ncbi:hypothetical protein OS493_017233 [Desmophyllum pertusum]|uniref:Uncharacterized protein n=1 Tax=Desmophyllum pertusum TaxID=174260 RepID=A0A9X0A4N1_9CNID|nr:hypothetical protein OS493_017233 [Desmophyllum pertusum]
MADGEAGKILVDLTRLQDDDVVDLTESPEKKFKRNCVHQEHSDTKSDSSDDLPSVLGEISDNLPSVLGSGTLPFDIDGDKVFKLRYNANSPANSTSDGRPWNAYFNSKRSGFNGIRRRASCKGSPKCSDQMCWYKRQYGKENNVNFGSCPAVKVLEVSEGKQWVIVYHRHNHTCTAINKGVSKKVKDDAAGAFQKSRQLKPKRYVNDRIITAIEQGTSNEEVRKVAESLVNNVAVSNIKASAKAEMDSSGHNVDDVGKYRDQVCQKLGDPFLIYKVHNKSLDPSQPSFVFKNSREQMQIAVDMDRQRNNPLIEEYCHLDGNHKRCAGYKTITLWLYHPFL